MGITDEVRAARAGISAPAQRRFTNRVREMARFDAKRADLRRLCEAHPELATDLTRPRRNVLVFHGHAGIGKTRLSRELRRRVLAGGVADTRSVTVHMDFADPGHRDPELFLLALRSGLADLADRFEAFDTALAIYWARRHPGRPLPEFITHQSGLGGMPDRADLADHFRDLLGVVADNADPTLGATRRLVSLTWETIRDNRMVRRLRRDCPRFETYLADDDTEALRLHLPALLAWDLSRLKRPADVEAIIFLDTFERVTGDGRGTRPGDLEDSIAQAAYLLPSALFVITTRRALNWGEATRSTTLEVAGPDFWPGLVGPDNGEDQHELEVLSPEDCDEYLRGCFDATVDARFHIDPSLRAHIVERSGGVPLYLDVAVNHHIDLVASGRTPQPGHFEAGIPQIVQRLMDDMTDDETDLVRVAALLGVFDRRTLRAALPRIRSSMVDSFLELSFVLDREDGTHSIHELLQTSVRTKDAWTVNPWSPDDWRDVGGRLVRYWSQQFGDDQAALWLDQHRQALAFWQLCGLYATTDLEVEVLAEVTMLVQLQGSWAVLDAGRAHPDELVNARGQVLFHVLDGILDRQIGDLAEVERVLDHAVTSPHITPQLRRLAGYYLAETLDLRSSAPTGLFEELSGTDDRIGDEARLAYAHAVLRDGDLATALALADQAPDRSNDPELHYRLHELLGTIRLCSGDFGAAAHHFELSRRVGEEQESALFLALGLRHLALARCWTDPDQAFDHLEQAERLNRDLRLPPGIGQCLTARAVASIGTSPLDEVLGLLEQADEVFTSAGYPDDAILPVAASVLAAAAIGDLDLARRRHEVMTERGVGRRPRSWLAVADIWVGVTSHLERTTWTGSATEATQRWLRPLDLHRERLA